MTMDRTRYDYPSTDIHQNVLVEVVKGEEIGKFFTPPGLERVARRLAQRNPQWKLTFQSHPPASDGVRRGLTLKVYHGNEELGWIGTSRNYSKGVPTIIYNSPALNSKRDRKLYSETTKEDVAVKAIEKNFFAKPISQILNEQSFAARSVIIDLRNVRKQRLNGLERDVNSAITRYGWDHIAEIKEELVSKYAVTPELIADVLTTRASLKELAPFTDAVDKKAGAAPLHVITIMDGMYYVCRREDNSDVALLSYTTETLPPAIKRKIGMLKLVEAHTFVAEVGVRVNSDTYAVLGEVE